MGMHRWVTGTHKQMGERKSRVERNNMSIGIQEGTSGTEACSPPRVRTWAVCDFMRVHEM